MRPWERASILRTVDSVPSPTGNAPGILTLPITYTLPLSGTRISSPPFKTIFRAGSAASIRPLTRMRWTSADEVPFGPGWVRVTRISGPASGARPPARVMASSKVTGPVAWKVRGSLTAPATEMGWLLYSATLTVTNGSTIICSSCKALAMVNSSSPGIRPCAFTRCLSMGRRMKPSTLTRTVRVSSGASYTDTAIRSLAPIGWAGRLAPGVSGTAVGRVCADATDRKPERQMSIGTSNEDLRSGGAFDTVYSFQGSLEAKHGGFQVGHVLLQRAERLLDMASGSARVESVQHFAAGEVGEIAGAMTLRSGFQLLVFVLAQAKYHQAVSSVTEHTSRSPQAMRKRRALCAC